jgi:hypothetical protein
MNGDEMKKICSAVLVILLSSTIYAQQSHNSEPQKYALVIGNGAYSGLSRLANPVNDANDMAAALQSLGFTVDKVLNGNLVQMESAISKLKDQLSGKKNSYGFLFYAGHGVQSNGDNFLIPVNTDIPGENHLRTRAVSVQVMLNDLNDAGNELNIVVLDACRDNPFGWNRSGSRGLTVLSAPQGSIVVYATSANSTAEDGTGRNGLFTGQLLKNLVTPGLNVQEIFNRTGEDVLNMSGGKQHPEISVKYFSTAYLGNKPSTLPDPKPRPAIPAQAHGTERAAHLWTIGASIGTSFSDPWAIGTVHGTIAPFKNSFLELGFEIGMISGIADAEKYYSLYPFAHYALFLPFAKSGGWYAGAGGGFMLAEYAFPEEKIRINTFALDFTTGVNILNILGIAYTLRTDFKSANNKFTVGYTYRFK